jgi:hypothetical protein
MQKEMIPYILFVAYNFAAYIGATSIQLLDNKVSIETKKGPMTVTVQFNDSEDNGTIDCFNGVHQVNFTTVGCDKEMLFFSDTEGNKTGMVYTHATYLLIRDFSDGKELPVKEARAYSLSPRKH